MLVIDNNEERDVSMKLARTLNTDSTKMNTAVSPATARRSGRVYLHTLAGAWGVRPGLHAMTGVKVSSRSRVRIGIRNKK